MVVGIDDVLYLTKREQRRAIALDIHKVLQSAANDLEKNRGSDYLQRQTGSRGSSMVRISGRETSD